MCFSRATYVAGRSRDEIHLTFVEHGTARPPLLSPESRRRHGREKVWWLEHAVASPGRRHGSDGWDLTLFFPFEQFPPRDPLTYLPPRAGLFGRGRAAVAGPFQSCGRTSRGFEKGLERL